MDAAFVICAGLRWGSLEVENPPLFFVYVVMGHWADALNNYFSKYGAVEEASVVMDRYTGPPLFRLSPRSASFTQSCHQ